MSDLTTANLQHLLDQATPGPWEYWLGEEPDERYIIDIETFGSMCIHITPNGAGSSCSDYDLNLAALAPELAEEVLRLRDALRYLLREVLAAAYCTEDSATRNHVALAVKTATAKIQGETND